MQDIRIAKSVLQQRALHPAASALQLPNFVKKLAMMVAPQYVNLSIRL
jgi:hypothetical protein